MGRHPRNGAKSPGKSLCSSEESLIKPSDRWGRGRRIRSLRLSLAIKWAQGQPELYETCLQNKQRKKILHCGLEVTSLVACSRLWDSYPELQKHHNNKRTCTTTKKGETDGESETEAEIPCASIRGWVCRHRKEEKQKMSANVEIMEKISFRTKCWDVPELSSVCNT